MTVPQVGHLPLMAFRPFFIVSSTAPTISFFALHLTQYPSGLGKILQRRLRRRYSRGSKVGEALPNRQLRKGQNHPSWTIKTCPKPFEQRNLRNSPKNTPSFSAGGSVCPTFEVFGLFWI